MSEDTSAVSSVKIKKTRWEYLSEWFRSPAFKSIVMWIITFLVILLLFFVVCIPQKYDLSVGRISRETINATKDVVDEVSTQEKQETARLPTFGTRAKSTELNGTLPKILPSTRTDATSRTMQFIPIAVGALIAEKSFFL